jgi:hypothetical protein
MGIPRRVKASPAKMARGVVQTAAAAVVGGLIDPEPRLAICRQCEHLLDQNRCGLCGCWMPAKAKVANISCPDGRW